METIKYTFLVDFARPQRTNELLVMQDDSLTRVARFILMNNGKPMDVSDVGQVSVNVLLPTDETIVAEAELSVDDDENKLNEVLFAIPASMTAAIGKSIATVTLYDTTHSNVPQKISSFEFYIQTRNELNTNNDEEDDDLAGLRDLMERAEEAIEIVEQLSAQTALPNPYPLRAIIEVTENNELVERQKDYNGSELITLDFCKVFSRMNTAESDIDDLETAVATKITGSGIANNDSTASDVTGYALDARIGKVHGDEIDALGTRMTTAEGDIDALELAVPTKITGSGIANNDSTTAEGYALDARMGKTHGDEIDALATRMTGAENKLAICTKTLSTSGWSATTTTVNGSAYYTQEVSFTKVYEEHPIISRGAAGTLPTLAEKAAFKLIEDAIANITTNKITFYAMSVPTEAIVVIVKGASA